MFGNYLGINGKPSKKPEAKYGRVQEKATPSVRDASSRAYLRS